MAGPCTLLVEPTKQLYTDAAGVHALPWHGTPMIDRRSVPVYTEIEGFPQFNSVRFIDYREKWALSVRQHLSLPPINYIDAIAPAETALYNEFLVTNGTKSNATLSNALYGIINDADIANQPFWEHLGRESAHGPGHMGTINVVKVVSTGGDVDVYQAANEASSVKLADFNKLQYFAIVFNANNVSRAVKFLANTAERGFFDDLLPYQYATLLFDGVQSPSVPSQHSGFDAGQPIGVRFKNTLAGEIYVVAMLSVVGNRGAPGAVCPVVPMVSRTTSDIPATYWYDPNAIGTVTVFAGTAWDSQARMGETFWRVPLDISHIPDDTHFTIAYKTKEMFGDTSRASYQWAICRAAASHTLAVEDGATGSDAAFMAAKITKAFEERQYTVETWNGEMDNGSPLTQSAIAAVPGATVNKRKTSPDMSIVTVAADRMTVWSDGESSGAQLVDRIAPGWLQLGDDELETLHLFPGATFHALDRNEWGTTGTGSHILSREHAIFNRPLTDAEYAFLNDPDAVWSLNMFSPPTTATVSGLDAPLYRGDDREVTITVIDADGDAVPLYGCSVWFTAKAIPNLADADDANAEFTCAVQLGNDGEPVSQSSYAEGDPSAGQVTFAFSVPFVTNNPVQPSGGIRYTVTTLVQWDVQVKDINGRLRTLATGRFDIASDVTRREVMP